MFFFCGHFVMYVSFNQMIGSTWANECFLNSLPIYLDCQILKGSWKLPVGTAGATWPTPQAEFGPGLFSVSFWRRWRCKSPQSRFINQAPLCTSLTSATRMLLLQAHAFKLPAFLLRFSFRYCRNTARYRPPNPVFPYKESCNCRLMRHKADTGCFSCETT